MERNLLFIKAFQKYTQPVIIMTRQLEVLEINQAACDLFRADSSSIVGESLNVISNHLNIASLFPKDLDLPEGNESLTYESSILRRKKRLTFKWTLSAIEISKKSSYILVIGEDISALRLAEEHVFELDSIISQMPGFVYWHDKEGHYLGVNENVAVALGIPREKLVNANAYELIKKHHPKAVVAQTIKDDVSVMNSGVPKYNLVYKPFSDVSHHTIDLLTSKMPLYNKGGKIVGIVGISIDITKLKQTEAQLRKAKEEAEAANVLKDQFIQNMEHDLRTPSSGLVGLLSVMVDQAKEPEQHQMLTLLLESSEELLNLINQMVSFNEIEKGLYEVMEKPMNIKKATEQIVALEKPSVLNKKLRLNVKIDSTLSKTVLGDVFRYKRILINLLGNAIKFTDEGEVSLTVERFKEESAKRVWVKIIVSDTGVGIPGNKKAIIWQKFVRLTPSNQGLIKGSGLGLYVVRKFVEELGGEIEVESEPTKGARFTCVLPFKLSKIHEDEVVDEYRNDQMNKRRLAEAIFSTPEEKPIDQKKSAKPALKKEKPILQTKSPQVSTAHAGAILLVEDSPMAQHVGQTVLEKLGYEVSIASTGKEAFQQAHDRAFDLIFMDLGLPDQDGRVTTQQIRADEKGKSHGKPIVGLTAHIREEDKARCLEEGMNAIMLKPLQPSVSETLKTFIVKLPKKNVISSKPGSKATVATSHPDLPVITGEVMNWELAKERAGDSESQVKLILQLLERAIADEYPKFKAAHKAGDLDELQFLAHKFRGNCSFSGATRLEQACSQLSEYLATGQTKLAESLYQRLMEEMEALREVVTA